ncbi:MAG: acyl transferase [Bacteroidetes bacterium]|nr:acyl transferase [Bacteroidota bacterium]
MYDNLTARIFSLSDSQQEFEALAIEVFRIQYQYNEVYQRFVDALGVVPKKVCSLQEIPFLPIEFFKTQKVVTPFAKNKVDFVFTSSGTTHTGTSSHHVLDIALYEKSFFQGFTHFFGALSQYCILALLPSYIERGGSSLVYMADKLIASSRHPSSRFYLHNYEELVETIKQLIAQKQPTILLGVSYALLDLAEISIPLPPFFKVMETGGMKGKRPEMLKEELHQVLKEKFETTEMVSEYGMTELLSQAYSLKEGLFRFPHWARVLVRDTTDSLSYVPYKKTGGINVVDLANLNSCSFIATQDLGKAHNPAFFELAGRFDNSDIRGCNLLVQ